MMSLSKLRGKLVVKSMWFTLSCTAELFKLFSVPVAPRGDLDSEHESNEELDQTCNLVTTSAICNIATFQHCN